MTSAFQIREATDADASSLCDFAWRLFVETFVEELGCGYSDRDLALFRDDAYRPDLFTGWIRSPDYGVWIAETPEAQLGYAVVGPCSFSHPTAQAEYGELKRLYLAREAKGRGIALPLMDIALDHLRREGRSPVLLSVWSGNPRAKTFYLKHGFRVVGEFKFPVGESFDDELLMLRD
jgi:ribosomal protein S18 acetylase RimI-like enzyme